ncbi:MAG: helix-hairpin-helix domain-containing protein [Chloroflexota bacterium]|nr:helix-hairpin-helix domain-containing protein [Chloroflexota bacterium]
MTEIQRLSVDINEGTAEELITVRGIGKRLAQRIIDQRPFSKLHDLVKVPGINEVKLGTLLPYLTIEKSGTNATSTKTPTTKSETKPKEADSKMGDTEAFLFLEDQKDRGDAFLIIFGGFILGLIILLLRRNKR